MIVPKEAFGNNYGGILLVGLVYKKRFGKMPNHKKGGFYEKEKRSIGVLSHVFILPRIHEQTMNKGLRYY